MSTQYSQSSRSLQSYFDPVQRSGLRKIGSTTSFRYDEGRRRPSPSNSLLKHSSSNVLYNRYERNQINQRVPHNQMEINRDKKRAPLNKRFTKGYHNNLSLQHSSRSNQNLSITYTNVNHKRGERTFKNGAISSQSRISKQNPSMKDREYNYQFYNNYQGHNNHNLQISISNNDSSFNNIFISGFQKINIQFQNCVDKRRQNQLPQNSVIKSGYMIQQQRKFNKLCRYYQK